MVTKLFEKWSQKIFLRAIDEFFPTSLTGDVTSEIAEDDWERRWDFLRKEACGLIFVCRSEEQLI